ncbi:uncharacterized protein CTHT_0031100 [Thermochaetoides thermophila DSM 1495]|uniref:18S rRNA factor 2 n=1 Tax=Chaetomium thermophilum (strain DSM 1495 / CBS 144.50 / IMI 039719) TaxID=759272 RepID=G0S487_CHATD|nr:hypothetical protein CTHT_0031100 [Thermochaetoides thermophila DSM 1495]EGS21261.1 hypothetical protein CTHT_0031100 [Thermochaetoides thermophila DSM 1495]
MPEDHKRNNFLDAGDSDSDAGNRSDSDDNFQKGGRSAKRRRVEEDESDIESDFSDNDYKEQDNNESGGANLKQDGTEPSGDDKDSEGKDKKKKDKSEKELKLPDVTKPLTKKNLVVTAEAIKKSGVIYLSRIPPFMKPQKLRSLLEPYGKINRIFLAPEDPAEHARRVRMGGNKKKMYTEGWVEFVKKKDAKKCVDLLNARTIGGKKTSWYRDDVWCMKYLKGFKWHHLTEQIAAENAERAARMRAEIAKTTKENKEFIKNVEKAKVLNGIAAKAEAKRKRLGVGEGGKEESKEDEGETQTIEGGVGFVPAKRRTFKQIPLAKKRKVDEDQPEEVKRVLSKIF